MAINTLTLFCLISGEHASRAFPVKVPSDETVGALKKAIISEKPNAFKHIDANDLVLWRATISTEEERDYIITLDGLDDKTKLNPTYEVSEYFKKKTLPKKSIHVIIERPQAISSPHTLELEALHQEIEDLRGGTNIVVLNVVVRPNRSECFSWTTDTETTSIKELEKAIYTEYPEREDGEAVVTIVHARGTPQHEGGGTEHPGDDTRFRNIIRQYSMTSTKTLTVALETPTKKYTDFTLSEVNRLYDLTNMDPPQIGDLPPFIDISTEPLESDAHKKSLQRLEEELEDRIRAIPSDTLSNEATCSAYVCSYLTQAVLIFDGKLTLAPERKLRGRHGHGKVDYAIEALASDGTRHVLGVTEVKYQDYGKGLAQNIVQLESSLTVRKRKRSCDDDGEEEQEEASSIPMRAYGIVTDAVNWFFVECTIDPLQDSGDRPKFKISKLKTIVNYNGDMWRAEAKAVLGQIVWLMRKMHSEIPARELRTKKQKFFTSGESSPSTGKMQRV
ncbi:hypothetical protein FBU30_003967 [Linnemannia zychae]|nr:hypothetical protein FBU30_003967 [Linnemannia zychae]